MFKQFDIVQIITTKSIKYLSGPEGHATSPHGNWSIVGFVGSEAIIAKEDTLVRIPLSDLRRVGSFNIDNLYEQLSTAGYLKNRDINMPDHISKIMNIDIANAREFLLKHNLKLNVKSEVERDLITKKVKELWPKRQEKN